MSAPASVGAAADYAERCATLGFDVARSTIQRILRDNGIEPAPHGADLPGLEASSGSRAALAPGVRQRRRAPGFAVA
jgi:hypothetical protein